MNNYRCENGCKHFEQHYCNFLHDRLANIEIVHIERVGCASHSDFQSERDIAGELVIAFTKGHIDGTKRGREKMLDELKKKAHITTNSDYYGCKEVVLLSDVEELRQAGE